MNNNGYNRPVPPHGATQDEHTTRHATYGSEYAGTNSSSTKKASGGGAKSFFIGLLGGVVSIALVLCLGTFTPILNAFKGGTVTSNNGNITINASGEDTSLAQAVAAKAIDSCVTIYVYSDTSSDWSQYFGTGGKSSNSPSALGSGVIIAHEGQDYYIVTNYHVVQGISRAEVKIGDKRYEATSVGYDDDTDLAVIKVTTSDELKMMEWGDSSKIAVGQWVMAIGSPYGYEQTVTTGIVSALYRSDVLQGESGTGSTVYTDMIQTDASINPGNSGGALVDADGKLIGINTYISSTSQSSAGLGFAIPASTAKRVAEQIMSGQTVTHAFLGITMKASTDPAGVAVSSVYKDTAAAKAGLQTGDVITKIDGKSITSPNAVSIAVHSKNVGDSIEITYARNGVENTVTATLGSDDANTNEYAENGAPSTQNQNNNGNGYSGNGSGGSGNNGFGLGDLFGFGMGGSGSGNSGSGGSGSGNSGSGSFWNNK